MRIEDGWQIQRLTQLYGIAIEARRFELFEGIFAPEVHLDFFGRSWTDRATIITDFATAHERYDMTQHAMTNHFATPHGNGVRALTYCDWRLARGAGAYWGVAWYDDVLARGAEGWRIVPRRCELLWSAGDPSVTGASQAATPVPSHVGVTGMFGD